MKGTSFLPTPHLSFNEERHNAMPVCPVRPHPHNIRTRLAGEDTCSYLCPRQKKTLPPLHTQVQSVLGPSPNRSTQGCFLKAALTGHTG